NCPARGRGFSRAAGECGWSSQTASGEVTGPGKQTLHRAVQLVGKPGGDPRHRGNLQARPDVDAGALQEVREVLRRQVAGRGARGERATRQARPDVDAVARQEIREVLRRAVAGRGGSERATTESAHRGVERDRPEAIE